MACSSPAAPGGPTAARKYASTANKASRSEQIAIAEKVLRGQGIGAWPVCGKKGGSSKHYAGTNTSGSHSTRRRAHRSHRDEQRVPPGPATARASTKHATHKVTRATSVRATGKTYVVRSGDTLSGIAGKHHIKGGWHTLYQLNRATISNPNLIFPGQRIAL